MSVLFQTYVYFIAQNRIDIIQSLEGRFEESVIAYLFLLNILPIFIIPMTWIETQKFTDVLNNWTEFEVTSNRIHTNTIPFTSHMFNSSILHAV